VLLFLLAARGCSVRRRRTDLKRGPAETRKAPATRSGASLFAASRAWSSVKRPCPSLIRSRRRKLLHPEQAQAVLEAADARPTPRWCEASVQEVLAVAGAAEPALIAPRPRTPPRRCLAHLVRQIAGRLHPLAGVRPRSVVIVVGAASMSWACSWAARPGGDRRREELAGGPAGGVTRASISERTPGDRPGRRSGGRKSRVRPGEEEDVERDSAQGRDAYSEKSR